MRALAILLGVVLAVVAVLFAIYTFVAKPKAGASTTIVQAPAAAPKQDTTAARLSAGAGVVTAIAGGLEKLGVEF